MYIRFLICTLFLFVLLACTPPDWHIARGATESGSPEEVDLGTTTERVYNCGVGGDTVQLTVQRNLATEESVQWEFSSKLEGGIGLPELGAELQSIYGAGYEITNELGTGWQLPAQPGEWIEYTLGWREVWVRGEILLQRGSQQEPVHYRLRRAIRSEIVDKKLLDCDQDAVVPPPATTPVPAAEPSATAPDFQLVIQGTGFAPAETTNPSQRRSMALLAAQMDAKRKLAVWLAGEEIEAVTLVVNGQVTKDEIRQQVSAWLVGVQILSEEYDEAAGMATVEIGPALGGARP